MRKVCDKGLEVSSRKKRRKEKVAETPEINKISMNDKEITYSEKTPGKKMLSDTVTHKNLNLN